MRKKLDNRIRILIENGVAVGHRSMFIVVGDKGKDQVVILHHILSKATIKARPSVLWCYKKELGFSTHRKKRMRQLQKKIKNSKMDIDEDDPFSLFIASTQIRFCYYSETHKILGNTYGMLVLQDFEAFTPNLLARTIETVEGGGTIVILLRSVTSLKQLYTMAMDVHVRYRTESHQDVVGRFNERFILSLSSCKNCLVINDQLDILPIFPNLLHIEPVPRKMNEPTESNELQELKKSLQDTQPVGVIVNCCRTLDQGKVLLKFVDCLSEKNLRGTVALTAARGRGKSAALGLAISAAVAFNYSNIFVTSPSPENLKTLFEFILKGFDALCYQEHLDYELIQSTNPEFKKSIVRVNVFRDHRQTIQYIHPSDAKILTQAELLVIDEAAAIPLPLVKNLLGPYLVFMASTVNGYEGTGRSLSLKLIQQLRQQTSCLTSNKSETTATNNSSTGYILHEVTLNESIRYRNGDPVEAWLNELLCLDASAVTYLSSGCPAPQECQLYYINRDTLFSYHKASEAFLQRIMALYVASHYKNSPNDLQMMSDAPAHNLFCLLPPVDPNTRKLPEVLCVVQVCMEGEICKSSVVQELSRGKRASGDLIPWTVSQQFQDDEFPSLSGARIVRIATHPEYQRMGYGSRALELIEEYYSGKYYALEENDSKQKVPLEMECVDEETIDSLKDQLAPKKSLPPLLLKLDERPAEKLDYIGVSFGLTADLLKFWKKAGYVPVYLRQTANDLTGEHSCIMLKILVDDADDKQDNWLHAFWTDFRRRFITLLAASFRDFKSSLVVSMLQNKIDKDAPKQALSKEELEIKLTKHDMKRLEMYSQNLVDYHLITDLLPTVTQFYFLGKLGDTHLSAVQSAILACVGLQLKTIDEASKELDLPSVQVMALFNKAVKRITNYLQSLNEKSVEETLISPQNITMEPLAQSLQEEMSEVAKEIKLRQQKELKALQDRGLSQYAIKGSEDEWLKELGDGQKTLVNIKSIQKRPPELDKTLDNERFQKKKKFKSKKRN